MSGIVLDPHVQRWIRPGVWSQVQFKWVQGIVKLEDGIVVLPWATKDDVTFRRDLRWVLQSRNFLQEKNILSRGQEYMLRLNLNTLN